MKFIYAGFVGFCALLALSNAVFGQQNSDVLNLDDEDAAFRLSEMATKGDLTTPGHAGAWIVLSSVALGVGRETCGLPEPPDSSFMAKPALDGMTGEQIIILNRMVTANYRSSEVSGGLHLDGLYPITRQAVLFLGWKAGNFDCGLVADVWDVALNYNHNRSR